MKKGQMILIVILLISVFLAILFSLATFVMNDQANQRRIDNSMTAYYAAESGLERAILQLKNNPTTPGSISENIESTTSNLTTSFDTTWDIDNKDNTKVTIQSTGTAKGVRRKLKTQINNTAYNAGTVLWPQYWIEISPNP